jgi:D-glycero-alpha-D-manno-heptose-7-phosphate kinase
MAHEDFASRSRRGKGSAAVIITQTPLRIGLLGGGTDLPNYYRKHGGRVLNCALDKYVYVIVKQRFDDDIYVNYSKKEIVSQVDDLQHELVREAMRMTGVDSGVEITTLADIPSAGSGLGSSSAVTVGLLHALFAYQGHQVSGTELAERACTIEIDRCGKPIGKQDQYIAALGGVRDIRFGPGEEVIAEELQLPAAQRRALQQQIMLFYTGITRSANVILAEQNANLKSNQQQLDILRDLAGFAVERLSRGDVDAIGPAIRESWEAKRKLASGVSTGQIDQLVGRALDAGAAGVKLTGAGGGGFLLVLCPMERQRAVRAALTELQELPVRLDRLGSRVIFNVQRDIWS